MPKEKQNDKKVPMMEITKSEKLSMTEGNMLKMAFNKGLITKEAFVAAYEDNKKRGLIDTDIDANTAYENIKNKDWEIEPEYDVELKEVVMSEPPIFLEGKAKELALKLYETTLHGMILTDFSDIVMSVSIIKKQGHHDEANSMIQEIRQQLSDVDEQEKEILLTELFELEKSIEHKSFNSTIESEKENIDKSLHDLRQHLSLLKADEKESSILIDELLDFKSAKFGDWSNRVKSKLDNILNKSL